MQELTCYLICLGVAVVTGLAPVGCASAARTIVEPPSTTARHETRSESAGRERTREVRIRITPPGDAATAKKAAGRAPQPEPAAPRGDIGEWIRAAVESGASVELDVVDRDIVPLAAQTSLSELADTGTGLKTSADEAVNQVAAGARRIALPWGGHAVIGKGGVSVEMLGGSLNALHILGGLVMLGAIVPIVLPPRRVGLAATIAGAGLLIVAAGTVADEYPWIFALAIVGMLGVLCWLAYDAWRSGRKSVALRAIAEAVEETDAHPVKRHIKQTHTPGVVRQVRAEVDRVK